MSWIIWRHGCAWIALIAVVAGCTSKPANPEEVLAARSLGVGYLDRNRLPEAEDVLRTSALRCSAPAEISMSSDSR